jgi:glycine dehydrogenase subunit 2
MSEVDVVRHYTRLERENFGVDNGFYPLGSCTMKYNPKLNEDAAGRFGFHRIHPLEPDWSMQGLLALMYRLTEMLCEITGMSWGTLSPFAGAHGEFTGMKLFGAYFADQGEERRVILVPDSAHGTNPSSARLAGFEVREIPTAGRGIVEPESLDPYLDENLAGIMLTNPNTLGLFEREIEKIAALVHGAGGLLYYDGANLNAIMGKVRPGDMGFDVVHLNLHKTFAAPHGGGGPGSGPVLVTERLRPYLPVPDVERDGDVFKRTSSRPKSIGRIAGFHGNVAVLVKAFAYLLFMGGDGLVYASEQAVLSANYLKRKLSGILRFPYTGGCKHEFVASAKEIREEYGVSALDIAKRIIDNGFHPPTMYFPLIVKEALMIEPTETESKETLDAFAAAIGASVEEARTDPELLTGAPRTTPVGRLDEVAAARNPVVRWSPE